MDPLGLTEGLVGLDTNIILRAVLEDDPEQSPRAREVFRRLTESAPGFVTSVTLAEVYWILSRRQRVGKTRSLDVIRRLVETGVLEFDDGEGIVRALELADEGADFADALIHTTFEQFGVTVAMTFDRDVAARLGWRLLGADDETR